MTYLYPLVSLEGDSRVRLDVEISLVVLVIRLQALHRLAQAGVRHVEVRTAPKGRGSLTALTVHQSEAALRTRGQVPGVLARDLHGAALHPMTVAEVLRAGEVKQVLSSLVVLRVNPVYFLVAKVFSSKTPAEVRNKQPQAVLFIMHQRVELLSVSAVYFYNISVM